MKKRGQIAFNVIVFGAIALIVLVIVILIFRGQIGKGAQGFTDISEQATGTISDERCKALFSDRRCLKEEPEVGDWIVVPGDWLDCGKDKTKEFTCYERIS